MTLATIGAGISVLTGIGAGIYPMTKTIVGGIEVTF